MVHRNLSFHLRTWILVAGLTALLVSLGVLLGGAWLYLFALVAVVFNLAGYWFSDRIALSFSRARPVPEGELPEVRRHLNELAALAGVPVPRLYLIPSEQPNAFAAGRNPAHAVVAVTEGLIHHMPAEHVRAVLAHEFAHIRNRDILVASVAAMIAAAISSIANILQFSLFFGGASDDDDSPLGLIGALVAMIVAPIAAMLLQLAVSRQREYLADATAAEMLGEGRSLAAALDGLRRGTEAVPMQVNPATASLYIANPLSAQGAAALFSTHPPIADRIRRLQKLDMELRSGIAFGR
jgi:heat shock protein HtpX